MIRRFLGGRGHRSGSAELGHHEDGSSPSFVPSPHKPPPQHIFQNDEKKKRKADSAKFKVDHLAPFDTCIEACDALASTSTSSGRVDSKTGLVDCSVLVSADGDLLIIPQEQQTRTGSESPDDGGGGIGGVGGEMTRSHSFVRRTASMLGEDYVSAIFVGNDLHTAGDKALNGFSAKGWSIPAASLAMKQSADTMEDLATFAEDLVTSKKSTTSNNENRLVGKLRRMVQQPENGGLRSTQDQTFVKETFPDHNFDVLPTRVGPLSSPGGTVQATLAALENYYSTTAESEARRWKGLVDPSGAVAELRAAKKSTETRSHSRLSALQEMFRRAKTTEKHLAACKEDAAKKWNSVHAAEEKVTKLVEEKMIERSRLREQQRLLQLKEDEEKRVRDAAHGNLGATSSEIWDIVSAVAASMEEGSFEPMDLPQAPLAAPRDQSQNPESAVASVPKPEEESSTSLPITSRHDLEQECNLPELRSAALAADEAVSDAANSLLNVLSSWDMTNRSARLAAETCLVSAANAQATCLRAIIQTERESLEERMKLLNDLEKIADNVDVRADMNHYITLDKKQMGGKSFMGDDDDGGVASALAVLNNHIDGNMGVGNNSSFMESFTEPGNEDDSVTPEFIDEAVDKFFQDNKALKPDAPPDDANTKKEQEEFEVCVLRLSKIAKDKSTSGRSRRSTICYAMNAKRNLQPAIPSPIQFEGLCRVFLAVLSGSDATASGAALAKMMMTLSQCFYLSEEVDGKVKETYVKGRLLGHPLWENEEFWDQALYQTVAESLTHSGVMTNFERPSARTAKDKKKSEWTEAYKMKWHDLNDQERCEAASQVHALVFAQLGALAHSMMEFGCGLERSCAFVRRMAVRNQLPMSQRAMLLQHLMADQLDDGAEKVPTKLTTPSR